MRIATVVALVVGLAGTAQAQATGIPPAIYTDPPRDEAHPARMEVLHIPSGAVAINGVAYLAGGPGTHPTVVICHGLPGNEKNLDLAQAVRRAGWNAITFNYRGSWGSPGSYRFVQNPEDAQAVLAFLRQPDNALKYGIDTSRIAIVGHSMGGWVAATVGGRDNRLLGVGMISSANMGRRGAQSPADVLQLMTENRESLAGVSPESMAAEAIENREKFDFLQSAASLSTKPVLILTSDDGLAPDSQELAEAIRAKGGQQLTVQHVATDHSWSDRRIQLQATILNWLQSLKR